MNRKTKIICSRESVQPFPNGAVIRRETLMDSRKGLAILSLGVSMAQEGPVVIYTTENSWDEIRRNVFSLGKPYPRYPLYVIPLLNAIGPYPFVLPGNHDGPTTSEYWNETREQLLAVNPKLIIFDSLASFVLADINKPEVLNFTMGLFHSLAAELNACVIVCGKGSCL